MVLDIKGNHVVICDSIIDELPKHLTEVRSNNIFILSDSNTNRLCVEPLLRIDALQSAHRIIVPAGDENKNLKSLAEIWRYLSQNGADRKSLLINIGGGMITDLGGFAASTFKRGIAYINIPTTLLGTVDAAVGGKNGINFDRLKNEIGNINPAKAVLVDNSFLATLDKENFLSGYAEMIKHALITSDEEWESIYRYDLKKRDLAELNEKVGRSVLIKGKIIEQDPTEKYLRKALNFGHTIGHAYESFSYDVQKPVLHGYAISMGMICELFLAHKLYGFPKDKLDSIVSYLKDTYGYMPFETTDYAKIFEYMKHDKKNEDGKFNFSLIANIGDLKLNTECDVAQITESLDFYRNVMS